MKKEIISKLKITFEDYVNEADGIEFWFAWDLQVLLGIIAHKIWLIIRSAFFYISEIFFYDLLCIKL